MGRLDRPLDGPDPPRSRTWSAGSASGSRGWPTARSGRPTTDRTGSRRRTSGRSSGRRTRRLLPRLRLLGHCFKTAPAIGRCMAELILDGEATTVDISLPAGAVAPGAAPRRASVRRHLALTGRRRLGVDGHDPHRRRHRLRLLRPHPAVRRPEFRPSLVQLPGGRGPRLEVGPGPWLKPPGAGEEKATAPRARPANPFLADLEAREPALNPFATERPANNPFLTPGEDADGPVDNPFAPKPVARPGVASDAPRKLQLLGRGLGVTGSFAKVLLDDDVAQAYAQAWAADRISAGATDGPSPRTPESPLPAVISLHRHDVSGTRRRSRPCAGGRRLRRPRRSAASPPSRPVPRSGCPRRHQRRHPGVLGVARLPAGDRRRAVPGDAP